MSPKFKVIQEYDPEHLNGVIPLPMRDVDDDDVEVTISDVEEEPEEE